MYDEALQLSEEMTGEETDSIAPAAFAAIATARGLLPPLPAKFVEPLAAAAELKVAREAQGGTRGSISDDGGFSRGKNFSGLAGSKSPNVSPGKSSKAPALVKSQTLGAGCVAEASSSSAHGTKQKKGGAGAGKLLRAKTSLKEGSSAPKTQEQLELLRTALMGNFLFRGIEESRLERILSAIVRFDVGEGTEVITQGSKGDFFYVLERGDFDVFVSEGEGGKAVAPRKLIHTYRAEPAEARFPCFGELALMYAKPRQASVVASTEGVLWGLDRANFRRASTRGNLLKVLRSVSILATLRYDQLQSLSACMTSVRVEAGGLAVRQDDPGDAMYIITQGSASVRVKERGEAVAQELMVLGETQYFGEGALLDNAPRSADVVAVRDLVLMRLTKLDFETHLGPLQSLLDADRRERAQRERRRQEGLEAEGLRNVRRSTLLVQARSGEGLYLCQHMSTQREYTLAVESKAALIAREPPARTREMLAVLQELSHVASERERHVAKALHTFHDEANLYTLLRGRAVCTLDELGLQASRVGHEGLDATPGSRAFIVGCLALGLAELHEQGVLYRGMGEPSAVIDARGYVMLSHFRYARRLQQEAEAYSVLGTPDFLAPEVITSTGHRLASDWWSLGVLVNVLVAGTTPWHLKHNPDEQDELLTCAASSDGGGVVVVMVVEVVGVVAVWWW